MFPYIELVFEFKSWRCRYERSAQSASTFQKIVNMPSLEYSRLIKRVVLSAPSKAHEVRVVNQVILAVSALSIAGAGWIIMSFCVSWRPPPFLKELDTYRTSQLFKQVRTFRHQLILGLAISDFWMAVNFLSSCAMNLSGRSIGDPSQKRFCSFNGFMTQFFVIQSKSPVGVSDDAYS